jgi:ankyrin repeat protein
METITIDTSGRAENVPREPTNLNTMNEAYWEMGDCSSGYDDAELPSPIQPVLGKEREYEEPTYTLPVHEAGKDYAQPPSPDTYNDDYHNDPSYHDTLHGHQRSRMRGRTNVVRALIEAHVPPQPAPGCSEHDEYLLSIHTAAYKGHLACVQVLVEEGGVHPDDVSVGHTALMRAVMSGNVDLVRWLLETRRVNPIRRLRLEEDNHSIGALEIAALEGKLACAEVLVDCMRKRGVSPSSLMTLVLMECAGMSGNEELLEGVLFWAGLPDLETLSMDQHQMNPNERAKLEVAIIGASRTGHEHIAKRILGSSSLVHAKISWSPLLSASLRDGMVAAAGKNNLEAFITFFDLALLKESSHEAFVSTLSNALYEAADKNARDMVVVLAEKHEVNVNDGSHNPHNLTPLIAAAGRGHLEVDQYLVDKASADIKFGAGEENDTPLWFAVKGGHQDVALFLLRHGGPVNEIVPRRKPNFAHPDSIYTCVLFVSWTLATASRFF